MHEFTNETINISALPKFEETKLNSLQKDYFKVMLIHFSIVYFLLLSGIITLYFIATAEFFQDNFVYLLTSWFILMVLNLVYLKISFDKKGFALREHDVIFKSGVISETTTIVTNNRVQHVALHQGMLSRYFGLASIELFTAGGNTSDLKISGLLLEDAKKIKESVSLKINNIEVENTEKQNETIENIIKEESNEF